LNGSLEGLQVVECARQIPGPFCAKLLADLGAEVIKVEEPTRGDPCRYAEPFLDDIPGPARSGLFLYLNANKKGITLDLGTNSGAEVFRKLVRGADVIIEDFPPGQMGRWGLAYEALQRENPRAVIVSLTPFGQSGPYRDYQSSDLVAIQLGGLGYFTPASLSDLRLPPLRPGGHHADFLSGLTAALVTMGAVHHRERTGIGSHIDLSQYEAMALGLCRDLARYSYDDVRPVRGEPTVAGVMGLLRCQDGWVHLQSRDPREWPLLLDMMDNPEWANDPRFADPVSRDEHWDELWAKIGQWALQHTKEEVGRRAQSRHLAAAPVNDPAEVFRSAHLAARGFFVTLDQPDVGQVVLPGAPYKFGDSPWALRCPAPSLGQHNEEILCQRLGYSREDLAKLAAARVV